MLGQVRLYAAVMILQGTGLPHGSTSGWLLFQWNNKILINQLTYSIIDIRTAFSPNVLSPLAINLLVKARGRAKPVTFQTRYVRTNKDYNIHKNKTNNVLRLFLYQFLVSLDTEPLEIFQIILLLNFFKETMHNICFMY